MPASCKFPVPMTALWHRHECVNCGEPIAEHETTITSADRNVEIAIRPGD